MADRFTEADAGIISDATERGFADVARLHDRLISEACENYAAKEGGGHVDLVRACHISRMADAVKAIMLARFPEAADSWFA